MPATRRGRRHLLHHRRTATDQPEGRPRSTGDTARLTREEPPLTDTTTATPTITPDEAAELYDELAWAHDTLVSAETPPTAGPWTLVGSSHKRESRWHNRYWLIVRDQDGADWGVEYGIGLTEIQENDLPWDNARGPLPLTRLYPHTVTNVQYRTKP